LRGPRSSKNAAFIRSVLAATFPLLHRSSSLLFYAADAKGIIAPLSSLTVFLFRSN